MKLLLCCSLILWSSIFASSGGETFYEPISSINKNLADTDQYKALKSETEPSLTPSMVSYHTATKHISQMQHLSTGNQNDINEFNEASSRSNKSPFAPRPFSNGTNSYWLDPNFQFGPGSVNDFGGNPNAEEMLQPYVF